MPQQFEHVRRLDILPPREQQVTDPHRGVNIPDGHHMDTLFDEAGIATKKTAGEVAVGSQTTGAQQPDEKSSSTVRDERAPITFDWHAAILPHDSDFVTEL